MRALTRTAAMIRSLFRRRRFEHEMEDEISFHLEARAADLIAQGLPEREARRQARLEFGAVETHKDNMRSAFQLRWADELVADIRYACRILRKSPGFTAIAVISLALAIGANTAIFSVANEMLYARLAVPHPEQLHVLYAGGPSPLIIQSNWGGDFSENGQRRFDTFPFSAYRQMQKTSPTPIFGVKDLGNVNVTANKVAQVAMAQFVSGNFYSVLQVRPQLGRAILPSDDAVPGQGTVALLSDGFWHRAFGASPGVLGQTINVDGRLITVIGVNPQGFTGAQNVQISPDLFLPLAMVPILTSGMLQDIIRLDTTWWVTLMTRLPSGVSPDATAAALTTILQASVRGTVTAKPGEHIPSVFLKNGSRGVSYFSDLVLSKPLHVLLALSGLVLLLACANIANLMLARASVREREMSVRLALGASRSRMLRQILTESLLLSSIGGALGLVLAYLGRNALPSLMSKSWDVNQISVPFNWLIFVFAAAITLVTGLLFGILPALRATREAPNQGLKETARCVSRRRSAWSGKAAVAFQIALCTILVASSALFLRTLLNLNRIDPGFRIDGLLTFGLDAPVSRYQGNAAIAILQRLEAAISAAPGVTGVTAINPPFLGGSNFNNSFEVEGAPPVDLQNGDPSHLMNVGRTFFPVSGIRVLRGRGFGPQDTPTSAPVSVINEAAARKFFPHSDPIGRRFKEYEDDNHVKHWRTIVGVCADTLYSDVRDPPAPTHFDLYVTEEEFSGATFLVRSNRPPAALADDIRQVIRRVDPDLPMISVHTERQQFNADLQQERLFAALTTSFGVLALLLASVGVYGIMAYTVTQRTNEIGIRLALGAQRHQVRSMVLREAAWLSISGVVAGLVLVLALVRLVQTMLYGLQPRDPVALIGTALILLAVALFAGWLPALRASRVEPMIALRHE